QATPTNTLYTLSLHDALPISTLELLQQIHVTVKTSLDNASRLRIPRLENMEEGQPLSEFLLTEPLSSYLPDSTRVLNGKYLDRLDRKSTRLNSSHVKISYAVF